jgi:hypothetical protein
VKRSSDASRQLLQRYCNNYSVDHELMSCSKVYIEESLTADIKPTAKDSQDADIAYLQQHHRRINNRCRSSSKIPSISLHFLRSPNLGTPVFPLLLYRQDPRQYYRRSYRASLALVPECRRGPHGMLVSTCTLSALASGLVASTRHHAGGFVSSSHLLTFQAPDFGNVATAGNPQNPFGS